MLRWSLKKGRAETQIGGEALTILERCAANTKRTQIEYAESRLFGAGSSDPTYAETQKQASLVAYKTFIVAIEAIRRSLISRLPAGLQELETLRKIDDQLAELAEESSAASRLVTQPGTDETLQQCLARIRAFKELHGESVDIDQVI